MYNADGLIENYNHKRHLDKIEQKLEKKYPDLTRLVKASSIREFLRMIKPFEDLEHLSGHEVKSRLHQYYKSYIAGTRKALEFIELAKKYLWVQEELLQKTANWPQILEFVRTEALFGCIRLWKNKGKLNNLSTESQQVAQELDELFQQMSSASRAPGIAKKVDKIPEIRARIQFLFKYKRSDLLENLLLSFDKYHDPEAVLPYRYLVQGYLAELSTESEKALAHYQEVLVHGSGPLEEALLRIAKLNLRQGNNQLVNEALGCLAQLNVRYLMLYADNLRRNGLVLEAIDAYNIYINIFPQDIMAKIKLAQFYLEQKINDGAELMINHILEQNPNHETALKLKQQLPY